MTDARTLILVIAGSTWNGLCGCFTLWLLEAVVNAVTVDPFGWPFSNWWGMLLALPALVFLVTMVWRS